jgi:hypothetical protein
LNKLFYGGNPVITVTRQLADIVGSDEDASD